MGFAGCISVRAGDSGYCTWVNAKSLGLFARVFCDDVEVPHCIAADIVKGWALSYDEDASGRPYLNPEMSAAVTREWRGVVRIQFEKESAG